MLILCEVLQKLLLHTQSHPESLQLIESITILRSVTFNICLSFVDVQWNLFQCPDFKLLFVKFEKNSRIFYV